MVMMLGYRASGSGERKARVALMTEVRGQRVVHFCFIGCLIFSIFRALLRFGFLPKVELYRAV